VVPAGDAADRREKRVHEAAAIARVAAHRGRDEAAFDGGRHPEVIALEASGVRM
jgi:hypothetical protein